MPISFIVNHFYGRYDRCSRAEKGIQNSISFLEYIGMTLSHSFPDMSRHDYNAVFFLRTKDRSKHYGY